MLVTAYYYATKYQDSNFASHLQQLFNKSIQGAVSSHAASVGLPLQPVTALCKLPPHASARVFVHRLSKPWQSC